MLKKTITFDDLDGNPVTEVFHFNLSKAELTEMELSQKGGLSGYLKEIVESQDHGRLIAIFKDIITRSVGRRSEDGRRFIKNQETLDEFMQTDAYSELFMELATQADAAVAFITAIVPASLEADLKQAAISTSTDTIPLPGTPETDFAYYAEKLKDPSWTPNPQDIQKMDKGQLAMAFQRKASSVE